MPECHLRQPGSTYSACRPFRKHRERIKKSRESGNLKDLYRTKLDKACFAHDAAYSESKDLAQRTISGKVLKDRACEIPRNPNYDGHQRALASIVYKFSDKKTGLGASVNEDLAEKLQKPVVKKIEIRKAYPRFKDHIWVADLGEMGSLSSPNRCVKYLLCVIDVFTKYVWTKSFKVKQVKTVLNGFVEIVNESNWLI